MASSPVTTSGAGSDLGDDIVRCELCGGHNDFDARQERRHEMPPRARSFAMVAWCSFLAASAATMVTFAYVDPASLPLDALPWLERSHSAVYAAGFFFYWALCAISSALTIYMVHTERVPTSE